MTTLRDLTREALTAVFARPGRTILVSAGTLAGVATLVATLGLATTARAQINDNFNAYTASEVTLRPSTGQPVTTLTTDLPRLADQIRGVSASGRYWLVDTAGSSWARSWDSNDDISAALYAIDPSTLPVIGPSLTTGRFPSTWDEHNEVPALLLSQSLARNLGISSVDPPSYVFLGKHPFLVVGIFNATERQSDVLLGAICLTNTADDYYGPSARENPQLLVATRSGSAQVVADQLPVAVRPDDPTAMTASAPADATALRQSIDRDVQRLLYVLAAVALVVGAFSITNATLVSVLERVPEIGLRRALGARKQDIGAQMLIEGLVIGTAGGLLGFAVGIFTVIGLSAANNWTPTMNISGAWLMPLAGSATGLLAAAYPAWRAAAIPAAQALQRA